MLAEENKNVGPSALDGKPSRDFSPPLVSFCIVVLFLTLLFILPLSPRMSQSDAGMFTWLKC